MANDNCETCHGTKLVELNEDHMVRCPDCCLHKKGYFKVENGPQAGRYACVEGCGALVDKPPKIK